MKILLVTRGFGKSGGISRTSLEAAEQLARRGHFVTVIASQADRGYRFPNIRIVRIRLLKIPFARGTKLKNLVEVPQFVFLSTLRVLMMRKRYDVVWNKGNAQCLLQDVITAESCHHAWIREKEVAGEKKHRWYPLHRFVLWAERRNYGPGRFRRITAISRMLKRDIMESYPFLSPDDIEVIRNGVNFKDFAFDETAGREVRRSHSIPEDHFVLLFVGWEFDRKGLGHVIRALPLIRGGRVRLLVVGASKNRKYESIAEAAGVSNMIAWCGAVEDTRGFYSAADFFVFPTRMDAFGLVVLEAMCAGNIVITSRMAGASELILNGENGFILEDYESAAGIAEAIDRVIADEALRSMISEKAVITAAENDWEKIAGRYERLFESLRSTV